MKNCWLRIIFHFLRWIFIIHFQLKHLSFNFSLNILNRIWLSNFSKVHDFWKVYIVNELSLFLLTLWYFCSQNSTVLNYFSSKLNTETFEKTILYVKRRINNWLACFLQIVQFIMHQHFSFSPCFAIYNAHQSTTIKQNRKNDSNKQYQLIVFLYRVQFRLLVFVSPYHLLFVM